MGNLTIGRRQLLGSTAALASVLAASACGMSGSNDKSSSQASINPSAKLEGSIQFQTWSLKNEKFTPYFDKLVKSFEKEHPGTTIKWVDQPGEGYEEKVQQQATAGQLPDVVNIPPNFAWQLCKANKVMDLKKADAAAIDKYTKGGIDAYSFDGYDGVYGYPWYLGTDLNWWNTEAFEKYGLDPKKLPSTLDKLYAQAITMAEKSHGTMPLISTAPTLGDLAAQGVEVYKTENSPSTPTRPSGSSRSMSSFTPRRLCPPKCCRTITSVTRSYLSKARLRGPLARPPSPSTSRRNCNDHLAK